MPGRLALICFALTTILALAPFANAAEDPLRRRGDLGAAIASPDDGKPARIVRFRPDSILEKAGLAANDGIVELNGRPASDANVFGATIRAIRGGDTVRLVAKRGERLVRAEVVVPAMRREEIDGLDIRYGSAVSAKGYAIRTYTTRPSGVTGKLPVIVFIPWLSCGPIENPFGPRAR